MLSYYPFMWWLAAVAASEGEQPNEDIANEMRNLLALVLERQPKLTFIVKKNVEILYYYKVITVHPYKKDNWKE